MYADKYGRPFRSKYTTKSDQNTFMYENLEYEMSQMWGMEHYELFKKSSRSTQTRFQGTSM